MTALAATKDHVVSVEDTAAFIDASLPAAASTPFVLSLCELTCHAAMTSELSPGETTVGSSVTLKHLAPTPVGHTLRAAATLTQRDGRKLLFEITVTDDADQVVATAVHQRIIVDLAGFSKRFLEGK